MARTAKDIRKHREEDSWYSGMYGCNLCQIIRRQWWKKSESIETQVTLIKEFIQKHNENPDKEYEIAVYDIYSDLGKTGTNFDRPGFERMMNDVRAGKINCILVKDFSRFGRNYIETGNYLEKILPFMKVRFISVCDNYDSFALVLRIRNYPWISRIWWMMLMQKTFPQKNGRRNVLHKKRWICGIYSSIRILCGKDKWNL